MESLSANGDELIELLLSFMLPFVRAGAFLMASPVLGSQMVPMRVRLILAVIIALILSPVVPVPLGISGFSLELMIMVAQQVLIGIAMGFFLQLCFHVFVLTGQMIAMQMGLGFASMVDPSNGVNVAIVSTIYLMFATMLFITLDGHLVMIEVLAASFSVMPVSGSLDFVDFGLSGLVGLISWVFSSAMVMALPALTALLITNLGFGIMTRAAPQMNIFALGFPVALLFGLALLWFTFDAIAASVEQHFQLSFYHFKDWMGIQ